jgi:transcriptional regulator with XRE-family HTH domain
MGKRTDMSNVDTSTLGGRFRAVRGDRKMSLEQFAERLGVTRSHLSAIEYNKTRPSHVLIRLICVAYHVNYDWLADGVGDMYKSKYTMSDVYEYVHDALTSSNAKLKKRVLLGLTSLTDEEWEVLGLLLSKFK